MMLIEVNELKDWVENWLRKNAYYHPHSNKKSIPVAELYDIVEQMPTVDAIPVIRCKDCNKKELCAIYRNAKQELGFCAWAYRKEE